MNATSFKKVFIWTIYLLGMEKAGKMKPMVSAVIVGGILLLVAIAAISFSIKAGLFSVTPVSKPVAVSTNVVFTTFGNSSKFPLPTGAPIGNFKVLTAADITNASNTTYALGSAVGGDAVMDLNGSVLNGNPYTADILVGVNGSTSLSVPIFAANSTTKTGFQIESVALVGLGINSGYKQTDVPSTQPTETVPITAAFTGLNKGEYMLELVLAPTSTYTIGDAAATLGLYNIGGSTLGLSSAALPSGSNIVNFQINWKN